MTPEELKKWREAGKIAAQALEYGRTLIRKGSSMREVCDLVDAKIVDLGAKPAWPTQIANNAIAAHWTPDADDETLFDQELVCLDVGAHVDGYIGDNALTVDLSGKWTNLVKASRDALAQASKLLAPGTLIADIGKTIQETIESHGFVPVRNLSGHGISRFVIHDEPGIPNHKTTSMNKIQKDQIIAIEPFATNGQGLIGEATSCNVYALVSERPVRSPFAREVLAFVEQHYGPLPFTTRWIGKALGIGKAKLGIRELVAAGAVMSHPPLVEVSKGMVTVEEKTFYVGEKTEVLTKSE